MEDNQAYGWIDNWEYNMKEKENCTERGESMSEPNIVFIVIDALRSRNLSCYGYDKKTSPNIDKIAKDGILFENAYSTTNATDPSLTSIFSGKFPRHNGIINHGERVKSDEIEIIKRTKLLPEILKAKGYITIGLDWIDRWHKRGYNYYINNCFFNTSYKSKNVTSFIEKLAINFRNNILERFPVSIQSFIKSFYDKFIYRTMIVGGNNEAEIVTDNAINLLNKHKNEKFFLFIHYWDVHTPYNPPVQYVNYGRYRNLLKTNEIDAKKLLYDGAIKFVDHNIGRIFESLEDLGVLENTLLIITSDHGESLGEHEIYFDHHGLYEVSIKVPLIIWYPKFEPLRIRAMVQHVDIMPTILELLNVDESAYNLDGRSLLPLIRKEVDNFRSYIYVEENYACSKKCIIKNNFKYIFASSVNDAFCRKCKKIHGGVEELYDLNSDPEEIKNIAKEEKEVAEELKGDLLRVVKQLDDRRRRIERVIIQDRIRKLGSLGKI